MTIVTSRAHEPRHQSGAAAKRHSEFSAAERDYTGRHQMWRADTTVRIIRLADGDARKIRVFR